jgi:hypothetical protein
MRRIKSIFRSAGIGRIITIRIGVILNVREVPSAESAQFVEDRYATYENAYFLNRIGLF